jgi:hypothetical protein
VNPLFAQVGGRSRTGKSTRVVELGQPGSVDLARCPLAGLRVPPGNGGVLARAWKSAHRPPAGPHGEVSRQGYRYFRGRDWMAFCVVRGHHSREGSSPAEEGHSSWDWWQEATKPNLDCGFTSSLQRSRVAVLR